MYKTLIVVDNDHSCLAEKLPSVISFEEYLRDYPRLNEPKTRLINLCDTERYLSQGYYCSLLAEARQHSVLPSVKTINELRGRDVEEFWVAESQLSGLAMDEAEQSHIICLGKVIEPGLQKLSAKLFQKYPAPILQLTLTPEGGRFRLSLKRLSYNGISAEMQSVFIKELLSYTESKWRTGRRGKRYRWDMAILVNPNDPVPPSNKGAISRFVKAARKLGIYAQALTIEELQNINHFDALFIRETTAIDHYTYHIACKAEASGLVVLDDPNSILRCCNKVFLHDAFNYQGVPSLNTEVVNELSEACLDKLEQRLGYPMVLKMPEGSFSQGVYKVDDRPTLKEKLATLFQQTALVLAQEYLYTEYDWRIGVLNGRPIYACRYFMASKHWQIYNHGSKRFFSGGFETLPTFEVPKSVLSAALKAAKVVGSGLYGVDIKVRDHRAYVLEVNDNPNIDFKIEDAYLGEELYMEVMSEFLRQLELRGR